MAYPANYLQQVQTYQHSMLARLQNLNAVIANSNSKFKNFQDLTANLGSTVTFDKPTRVTGVNNLVWQVQSTNQRVQTLTVDQPFSSAVEFTEQEMLFNVEPFDFMKALGESMICLIGSTVEQNVSNDFAKSPYRFFGNGIQSINSFGQLADAMALFRNYGSVNTKAKGFIPDISVPAVVNSGLNQFAPNRNNEIANSWDLGSFANCEWYSSNQLQTHIAGSEGNAAVTLTVVSTVKDANQNITSITFSGCSAASDVNSIKKYDRLQILTANTRLLEFTGYAVSANPIQFMAGADAASTAGSQVTVTLQTPLFVGKSVTDSIAINVDIVAGMTASVLPSHRVGCIYAGDPHYIAIPQLGPQRPFDTAFEADPETGIAIRMTYGSQLGQNANLMGCDVIWGSTLTPEYAMAMIYPI